MSINRELSLEDLGSVSGGNIIGTFVQFVRDWAAAQKARDVSSPARAPEVAALVAHIQTDHF